MKIFKISISFYKFPKKFHGIGSFYSKYVIIGSGYAGLTLTRLLTNKPYAVKGDEITLIDVISDYTVYPLLKYHCFGKGDIFKSTQEIVDIVPNKVKFRNNDILQLEPKENLILGNASLRHSYEKLIIACGLEPDYISTPGLAFSLEDKSDPLFSIYEYEKGIPKFVNYSLFLIQSLLPENEYRLSKKNNEFFQKGGGNIIFANCSNDIYEIIYNFQMIILLYENIKQKREKILSSLNFYITLPVNEEELLNENSKNIVYYFLALLDERKIKIKWNYTLKKVESGQILNYEENQKKENVKMEYNFGVVMPQLTLPSFVKNSDICQNGKIEYNDYFAVTENEDIFLIGDAMRSPNFLDRFETNIFLQAYNLARNLKVDRFRLDKTKKSVYKPSSRVYCDFSLQEYHLFNSDNLNNIGNNWIPPKILPKNIWHNFLFKHFYHRPEGYYAQTQLLEKKFGIKISKNL